MIHYKGTTSSFSDKLWPRITLLICGLYDLQGVVSLDSFSKVLANNCDFVPYNTCAPSIPYEVSQLCRDTHVSTLKRV